MKHEHNPVVQELGASRMVSLQLDYNDFVLLMALLSTSTKDKIDRSIESTSGSLGLGITGYDHGARNEDYSYRLYQAMKTVLLDIERQGGFRDG